MNKCLYIIGVFLFVALPSFSQVSNDNEDEVNKIDTRLVQDDYVPGQVLVKFRDENQVDVQCSRGKFASTSVDQVTEVLQKYGVEEMDQLLPRENPNRQMRRAQAYNGDFIQEHDLSQLYCVTLSAEHWQEAKQAVEELNALDEVEFAEPNYRIYAMGAMNLKNLSNSDAEVIADDYSGNPMESQQWYLDAYGVKELWNKPVINPERPVIAILDTGVDITHPDLKDNIWTNLLEEYGTKDNDNDGNGFKNDVHGWDFVNNSANIRDNNMHGTHVAGIAAAANNGIGIIGANPQALIMPITVLQSDGAGDIATIIKGINYAIDNGATVLNLSLGTYVNSQALRQALESAYPKAVLVAAAGNDNKCVYESHYLVKHKEPYPQPCFPAAYSFVLGAQATVKGGALASYSNYDDDGAVYSCESTFYDPDGYNYELKVPGSNILSTIPGGNYKVLNGTSMAAPLVSGAISVLKMVKQYDTHELLWGDLLHTNNIAEAYQLTGHPADLELQRIILRDRKELSDMTEEDYSGDNEVDAGETINIYPVIRTTFGPANNIKMKVMVDEFEDPDVVEIIHGEAEFGIHLDAFGKAVSLNPLVLKISDGIADARHIRLKLMATCDEITNNLEYPFTLVAHNMIKIKGLLTEDTKLTANHIYYVNGNLGVNKGVTLTIEPGTRLEFAGGTSLVAFGKLVAKGTPEKPITFTRHVGEEAWNGIFGHKAEGAHDYFGIYTNNDSTLFTLFPTEDTPIHMSSFAKKVYYQPKSEVPSRHFSIANYLGWTDFPGPEDLLTDSNYLTPIVKSMLGDFNDYCSRFSSVETETYTSSTNINAYFFNTGWHTYDIPQDVLSCCRIEDCSFSSRSSSLPVISTSDCVFDGCSGYSSGVRNVFINGTNGGVGISNIHNNYINLTLSNVVSYGSLHEDNFFNNYYLYGNRTYTLGVKSNVPSIDYATLPSYLGTSREDLLRPYMYEWGNTEDTWGVIDLSNMPKEPIREAHGIVWKVVVNGKDAQDEFEEMVPLGVGKHKFEVYFNRPMNTAVAPQISFGIRAPFTQQSVAEDGSWNADGTIYTAYKTITGKTMSDGLNRIYVTGAEDDEFFPCPYEKNRFNVIVQAAGSMATGFMAEEGLGCVKLKWDESSSHQEDAMGYNVYRYHQTIGPPVYRDGQWYYDELVNDTVRLNQEVLDLGITSLTDYDVTPGETYYYFYSLLSTDLQVSDISNTVAATPRTSTSGDANGSGEVDVADVITTVNYVMQQNPKPFIFEAADMNSDNIIDILDVMDIVKGILYPDLLVSSMSMGSASYYIEDGILYVESPVALGGVQVQLSLNEEYRMKNEEFATAADLDGFECASAWLSDNDYLLLAYSMNGRTLTQGKHALLYIGDAQVASLRLSDTAGRNVTVTGGSASSIDRMGRDVMTVQGIYDLQGRKLHSFPSSGEEGQGGVATPHPLKKGIYIINGKKVVK